jgi:hypothetical protein
MEHESNSAAEMAMQTVDGEQQRWVTHDNQQLQLQRVADNHTQFGGIIQPDSPLQLPINMHDDDDAIMVNQLGFDMGSTDHSIPIFTIGHQQRRHLSFVTITPAEPVLDLPSYLASIMNSLVPFIRTKLDLSLPYKIGLLANAQFSLNVAADDDVNEAL